MTFTELCNQIFTEAIRDYHVKDSVEIAIDNPYEEGSIENKLYKKNWIDTRQWHLEDMIRVKDIRPESALNIKKSIDKSNQDRTDLVETIDDFFLEKYRFVNPSGHATLNTETPAWAIDRLSILALKIYHMCLETQRTDADAEYLEKCKTKLETLLEQQKDLSLAIDQLLEDLEAGRKQMKVYRQMKMYIIPKDPFEKK